MTYYLGRRMRAPAEQCPTCKDPGVGMVLRMPSLDHHMGREWICSRCYRREQPIVPKETVAS